MMTTMTMTTMTNRGIQIQKKKITRIKRIKSKLPRAQDPNQSENKALVVTAVLPVVDKKQITPFCMGTIT